MYEAPAKFNSWNVVILSNCSYVVPWLHLSYLSSLYLLLWLFVNSYLQQMAKSKNNKPMLYSHRLNEHIFAMEIEASTLYYVYCIIKLSYSKLLAILESVYIWHLGGGGLKKHHNFFGIIAICCIKIVAHWFSVVLCGTLIFSCFMWLCTFLYILGYTPVTGQFCYAVFTFCLSSVHVSPPCQRDYLNSPKPTLARTISAPPKIEPSSTSTAAITVSKQVSQRWWVIISY